ncbi:MAG: hypothetical protein EVA65_05485 [Oceanococcus sp.]|nr:MAG: hypothetical protein EVA65_05485 [Oceanococcus sp.]
METKVITPKDILTELVTKTKAPSLKPWDTTFQGWLFGGTGVLLFLGLACAGIQRFVPAGQAAYVLSLISLSFLVLAILGCAAYQVSMAVPLIYQLGRAQSTMLEPVVEQFDSELALIRDLQVYELSHLQHASDRLKLVAEHLRARIAILVGAVEKVGVFPLFVTGFFSIQKLVGSKEPIFSGWEIASAGLIILYLVAVHLLLVSHHLDRMNLTLQRAVKNKEQAGG